MEILISLLQLTAWKMDPPEMFGSFHLTAVFFCIGAAFLFALICSKYPYTSVLSKVGWILAILEIYKQLFICLIVNNGAYDWWFFPFQLCSIPMYLCILLPYTKGPLHSTMLTFMGSYTFISALAALIYPEDFLRPYYSLTLHGFLWHGSLLFISVTVFLCSRTDYSAKGFARATGLFMILSIIALLINIVTEPLMQAADVPDSYTAMFYLNPYHFSPQLIVGSIQRAIGIPAGLILYLFVIIAASGLVDMIFMRIRKKHIIY